MNKRFGGMVGMALMGLVAIGLGGALFLQTHAPVTPRAAAPGAAGEPRVAFAGNNAALAGLLTQSTAMGAVTGCGVSWELNIVPNPVKPATTFSLGLTANDAVSGAPLRVNRAAYYYKKATVAAYKLWLQDATTNAKPNADNVSINDLQPLTSVLPLPLVEDTSEAVGFYDVFVEGTALVSGANVTCGGLLFTEYLQVFDVPTASFEAKDYTVAGQALLPAGDWTPLFGFNMKSPSGTPAPRVLTKLIFEITGGPTEDMFREFALFKLSNEDLPSDNAAVQARLFLYDPPSTAQSNALILAKWDSHGWPWEMPTILSPTGLPAPDNFKLGYKTDDEEYDLSPTLDATNLAFPLNERLTDERKHVDSVGNLDTGFSDIGPKVPFAKWVVNAGDKGNSYIVCARLSQTWRSRINLGITLHKALMQPYFYDPAPGVERYRIQTAPTDATGKMVDSYNPDFFTGETISSEGGGYTSVFDVFDPRGGAGPGNNLNLWNHPVTLYTPVPGFARPRWDLASQTVQFVGGELMDMRQLFSVESWVNVLGINADGWSWDQPMELNLVFTDIGADPFAMPGNGGFDPREGLDTFTLNQQGGPHTAIGQDYAFNGVWLWYDNNADGIFNPPTPNGTSGVTFNDHPMVPMRRANPAEVHLVNPGNHIWEYEPFPPGGGDPWWKMRITLGEYLNGKDLSPSSSGRRRADNTDNPLGYMAHPVKNPTWIDPVAPDYFVVMRADSGFKDVNGTLEGDGVGIDLGADMRVFLEPRRWNPRNGGHWDGGMLFRSQALELAKEIADGSAQFPDGTSIIGGTAEHPRIDAVWQDFEVWQTACPPDVMPCPTAQYSPFPWWTERMHNQDTVKPLRCGTEVHDLVLTYSTDNRYGKYTPITVGQNLWRFFSFNMINPYTGERAQYVLEGRPIEGHGQYPGSYHRSELSIWADPAFIDYNLVADPATASPLPPINDGSFELFDIYDYFGLQELRTPGRYNAGVSSDLSALPASPDSLTDVQYAFETVPFQLAGDGLDDQLLDPRSTYFPNPPSQPTLPRYSTWSGYQSGTAVIAWGETSQCYLASEGAKPNGIYMEAAPNAESNYDDDDYVFVVGDIRMPASQLLPGDLTGKWLVDQMGGRYYIASNSGATLHLRNGHGAYLAPPANVPVYPYQVPVGPGAAVERGRWQIVEDSLPRGFYPRIEDWAPENLLDTSKAWAARLLKQYIAAASEPIAMLGINVAGTDDPAVNADSPIGLNSVAVAFWGPEFEPSQLAGLDANGELYASGVLLYENSSNASGFAGVFDGPIFSDLSPTPLFRDRIVPLEQGTLLWTEKPEPIDLDADYEADDLSGDSVIFLGDPKNANDVAQLTAAERALWDGLSDLAWVLELRPRTKWLVPYRDARVDGTASSKSAESKVFGSNWPSFWTDTPTLLDLEALATGAEKGLDPTGGNPGDDLFIVVRTSNEAKAFSEFRAVIPAKLPTRTPASRQEAAIQMSPRSYNVVDTVTKPSPEEGAVQDFYGHDMIPAGVYTKVTDLTTDLIVPPAPAPVIQPGGLEAAILGIDSSVNRPGNIAAQGAGVGAQSGANTFTVADADVTAPADSIYFRVGQGWTAETVGLYLIGYGTGDISNARVEGYEITAVTGRQLTLRAGAPRADRPWFVIKDPTFLEQLVVEFYDFGRTGNFDLQNDLLPLNHEDPFNGQYSGVALYRDNDAHPQNTNGAFDPPLRDANGIVTEYVDLPVRLDAPPILIGTVGGEPEYQVKFAFSTPGTDNMVGRENIAYETQARNRQWVPQTTGLTRTDADFGSDFFVVVRPSNQMALNDRFQAAIVSWGPNTPTEPDPDNFSVSLSGELPGQHQDEFDKFSEFPWGSRAIGYITLFQKPQPIYYWGFDKLKGRTVPREDVDRSQDASQDGDGSVRALRNWVRTNPALATRTLPITSLEPPQLDFVGVPTRQRVNADVNFTLLGVTQVTSILWDFGDGTSSTEINPVHQYAATGLYTVQVTVVNQFGIRNSARKVDYIEIIDTPFADFTADPVRGAITPGLPTPALVVTFTDSSVGGDSCTVLAWSWNFGDGTTSTEQNPVHRYTAAGIYTVTLETTFQCSDGTVVRQRKRDNYVTVLPCVGCETGEGEGEGEGSDPPAADITFTTLVKDKEAIVPLSDWVQLFRFTMSYGEEPENVAPRILSSLTYYVNYDSRLQTELGYVNHLAPYPTDLLEFGVFKERTGCDDCAGEWGPVNGQLDPVYDDLLFTWDNLGAPAGKITAVGELSGIVYTMDFVGKSPYTPLNPQFRLETAPTSEQDPDGNSYIIAVRSSATWRSQLTMGVEVWDARMINPNTGGFPVDKEGKPIDSYSPNFYDNENLEDKQFYSSSFGVYDYTGSIYSGQTSVTYTANAWNYPNMLYMPLGEFSRPRWNAVGQVLQVVAGEFLQLRTLTAIDEWKQVIGINAHSTRAVHFDRINDERGPQLREVNVILTDIGGDPYGDWGNGGFDPRDGLEQITTDTWGVPILDAEAYAKDVTYNGCWVWHDTNNNGVFDPPTMNAGGGVTFAGDFPMLPSDIALYGEPMPSWEYIPLPPGGGDPWWKISLRFYDGDRKVANVTSANGKEGFLEPVPDNRGSYSIDSEWSPDYFVVVRTDSGFKDVSLGAGDGSGIAMGADFRAFIEPRRIDPVKGTSAGGIYLDSMIPYIGIPGMGQSMSPWQNDVRWLTVEPWWPQRTMNQSIAKPLKVGVEVHDLVMTYESQSNYRVQTDLFYLQAIDFNNLGQIDPSSITLGGYSAIGIGPLSGFDQWLDPFGLEQAKFQNGHTVDVIIWRLFGQATIGLGSFSTTVLYNDRNSLGQFAYETVPFFNNDPDNGDAPPAGPRSTAYPIPPVQPTLPEYSTWSAQLKPGEYPRASQWTPDNTKARLLTQKTEANSFHTAMLGVNLIASADPYVNNAGGPMSVAQISVAFWGPDFTPEALKPLNPDNNDNQSLESGVLLWEDADNNGIFLNTQELASYQDGAAVLPLLDRIVPVTSLSWSSTPELVDINGDGKPDDMSGDGIVDDTDRAWVLTFFPKANWTVPQKDGSVFNVSVGGSKSAAGSEAREKAAGHSVEVNGTMNGVDPAAKALDPAVLQAGDDLFISVSTSDKVHRFQQFRAFVPATLPARSETLRKAGIQFYPQVNTSGTAFVKGNPEEDPVQDFFGMDMLMANVPLRLVDMTNRHADIDIGGGAIPVVGIDAATGLSNGTLASGDGGIGLGSGFRVPAAVWAADQYKGDWLVDSGYETYEITGNVSNEMTLLSGTPRNGKWRIVRDPSFLEEFQVELYVEKDGGSFNPLTDLLPLDIDPRISGVAFYRDNDSHPDNRNGIFDPDIDIPVALDAPPRFSGQTAEDIQVKFVFSTPGTDNYPIPMAAQTRHRQWVQDGFGSAISDADYGPDFFVVVRAAQGMQVADKFRAGIMSWGPNTPTEPDPDTWANLPGEDRNDYVKFREFPWADRGVGFVSFFKDPQKRLFMDGSVAGVRDDNSGFNWVRSHSSKKRRTGVIEARVRPVGPNSLVIEDASELQIPSQTLPGECFPLIIYGTQFGPNPVVVMSGYDVVITAVSDTAISICISTKPGVVPQEPVVLLVRNPVTGEEVSRSNLFTIVTGSALRRPKISGVDPAKGSRDVFPVRVLGENFGRRENIQVKFGQTFMPVLDVAADGTSITVGFPAGGMPDPGKQDVMVRDTSKNLDDVLLQGFEYQNQAVKKKFFGLFACAGGSDGTAAGWTDLTVLLAAAGALFAARRRGAARAR